MTIEKMNGKDLINLLEWRPPTIPDEDLGIENTQMNISDEEYRELMNEMDELIQSEELLQPDKNKSADNVNQ